MTLASLLEDWAHHVYAPHGIAVLLLIWITSLFGSCAAASNWWPAMTLIFVLLGALPPVFGSLSSGGLWGAIGDFIMGCVVVSMFALPSVLQDAGVIDGGHFFAIGLGTMAFMLAGVIALTRWAAT